MRSPRPGGYEGRREPIMTWSLSDAFALAFDEKEQNPGADIEQLVTAYWAEMQAENEAQEKRTEA